MRINFGSGNAAATAYGCLLILALACAVKRGALVIKTWRTAGPSWRLPLSIIPVVAALLAATCLFLTASRAGILSAALGIACFFGLAFRRSDGARAGAVLMLSLLSAIGLLAIIGSSFVLNRLNALEADSVVRASIMQTHWAAFLDRPLLGHGLNSFHEINQIRATPDNWEHLRTIGSAHNIYIQLLEETGIAGASLFVVMLGAPLLSAALRALRGGSGYIWSAAIVACFILALAHGLVDFGLQVPAIAALLAFCLGAFSNSAPQEGRTAYENSLPVARRRSLAASITRPSFALVIAAALLASAGVYDSANTAGVAAQEAQDAQQASPLERTIALESARHRLITAWSRPTFWYAPAAETLSRVEAMRAQARGQDKTMLIASARAAEQSVR
ncbi:MAG: O-antigen ligase family protein, partial [Terricaulis silvestris]